MFLKNIWPSAREIDETLAAVLGPEMFRDRYARAFEEAEPWRAIEANRGTGYDWIGGSTYVRRPAGTCRETASRCPISTSIRRDGAITR